MKCEEVQEALLQAQPAEARPWVREHLAHCPECHDLARLWQLLGEASQPVPPTNLSNDFRARLAQELGTTPRPRLRPAWWISLASAALLILGLGIALGRQVRQDPSHAAPGMAELRYGSPTDRLEAIALINPRSAAAPDLQDALLERVQHDPSPEVRLSAVEALYLFGSDPSLSRKLEAALPLQTRPGVQLALVDLLAAIRQERAAEALRRLVRSGQLPGPVQLRAQQRLSQMNL